ncbi:MAG: hypothetical protein ABI599_11455 [Flavobacteriales bacterium]
MTFLSTAPEFEAFANLLTAAAVNKRLLMRILSNLEDKDLVELHEEVAKLNEEFRSTIVSELNELQELSGRGTSGPSRPVEPGALPVGREEERRGHSLPNKDAEGDVAGSLGSPLGRDEKELHGVDDK